jgi:hypothetical protein
LRNSAIFEFLASHRHIVIIVVSSVIACIMQVANERAVRKPAEKAGGWRYLKYGWLCRSTVIICGLFFGTILCITYAAPNFATSSKGILGARLVFGFLLMLCILLFYECFIRVVRFNSTLVESRHPFGTWQITIADIADVNFYSDLGLVQLISGSGARIWLPIASGTDQFGRYLRRKQRMQVLKDISIKKLDELKLEAEWQSTIYISDRLQSDGMTDDELMNHGASLVYVLDGEAWDWRPEMGSNVKATLLSGEACLCAAGHEFILEEGDTISLLTSILEPFAIANISENEVRLLVTDVATAHKNSGDLTLSTGVGA